LRVADTRERFEQPGIEARRVVGAFQKGIKQIGTLQF